MTTFLKLFLGLMYIVDGVCLTFTFGWYKPGASLWWARKIAISRLKFVLKE